MNHNDLPPGYLFSNVLLLKNGHSTGSSILVLYQKIKYIVTAKHVFPGVTFGQFVQFEYSRNKIWNLLNGIVYTHKNADLDVVVIRLDGFDDSQGYLLPIEEGNIAFGDFGYFLGFPLGIRAEDFSNVNNGFPIPMIKRAVYSGYTEHHGISVELLDGQNNPGFSGGPTFLRQINTKTKEYQWVLFSIVSAYFNQKNELVTPFGNLNYTENSGIIISYGVRFIMDILESVPD